MNTNPHEQHIGIEPNSLKDILQKSLEQETELLYHHCGTHPQ
jgi:hypothetical protein